MPPPVHDAPDRVLAQAAFPPWRAAAMTGCLRECRELGKGIERDRAAAEAALQYDGSNGQTEAPCGTAEDGAAAAAWPRPV